MLFSKGILFYVTYVTVSVGQVFVQTILVCSIDIQQADSMKKLSKMINYCHFSVAYVTGCYRITPQTLRVQISLILVL